jgi:hypothetical protein
MKNHFLNLIKSKGGFKPLYAHFHKSNVVTSTLPKKHKAQNAFKPNYNQQEK